VLLRSYTRLDEPYPLSYKAEVMLLPCRNNFLNRDNRIASANSRGASPVTWRNDRRSVALVVPNVFAMRPSRTVSSPDSEICFAAIVTKDTALEIWFGLHRKHARYPFFSASSCVLKKSTFRRSGRRAGQEGRQ
jgi:hypothetical protein